MNNFTIYCGPFLHFYIVCISFQLLYRCVQAINLTHDNAHAQMDVKLRSLVCLGLNEQVLHLWMEVLCSCVEVVQKWFVYFHVT